MKRGASDAGFHFLQDFRQCQKFFYWRYVERLETRHPSPKMIYGLNIHEGLARFYKDMRDGLPVHERVNNAIETFKKEMKDSRLDYLYDETYEEDMNRGIEMFRQYGLQYPTQTWKVLEVERLLELDIPQIGKFTGRIDMAARIDGRVYIVDHKTTGWALASLSKTLLASDQATGYMLLWNKNFPDLAAHGVIFNVIRQYKGSTDFKHVVTIKTEEDLERFELDAQDTISDIHRKMTNPKARWCMNTKSCYLYNRACTYMDLCNGANFEPLIGTVFLRKDDV